MRVDNIILAFARGRMRIYQQIAVGAGIGFFFGYFTSAFSYLRFKNLDIQAAVRVLAYALFGVLLGAKVPYAFGISAVATFYFGVLWDRMNVGNPFAPSSQHALHSSMVVGISAAFGYLLFR